MGVGARLLATTEGSGGGGQETEGLDLLFDVAGAIGDGERVAGRVVADDVDVGRGRERVDGDEEAVALVDEPLSLDRDERLLEGAQRGGDVAADDEEAGLQAADAAEAVSSRRPICR